MIFWVAAVTVPSSVVRAARDVAAGILRSAGIDAGWIECDGGKISQAKKTDGAGHFFVQLRPGGPRTGGDAAGYAVIYQTPAGTDGYAVVFYDRVVETARNEDAHTATVLGATLAHEIGHLLLGTNSHSPEGVMQARLGNREIERAERGQLRFSPVEAKRIREWAERRAMMVENESSSVPSGAFGPAGGCAAPDGGPLCEAVGWR